jgi:DNA-binding FadR family transcriptional regulator
VKEYTYSETRQRLRAVLERARRDGAVRIRRRDGSVFVLRPEVPRESPLDVPSLNLPIGRDELLDFIRKGRRPA